MICFKVFHSIKLTKTETGIALNKYDSSRSIINLRGYVDVYNKKENVIVGKLKKYDNFIVNFYYQYINSYIFSKVADILVFNRIPQKYSTNILTFESNKIVVYNKTTQQYGYARVYDSTTLNINTYQILTKFYNINVNLATQNLGLFSNIATITVNNLISNMDSTYSYEHLSNLINVFNISIKSSTLSKVENVQVIDKRQQLIKDDFYTNVNVRNLYIFSDEYDCIANFNGNVKILKIPYRLGEYFTIFELPESSDLEIKHVYRLPHGLKFDNKKLYGRLILNEEYTVRLYLSDNSIIDIILTPSFTEYYEF